MSTARQALVARHAVLSSKRRPDESLDGRIQPRLMQRSHAGALRCLGLGAFESAELTRAERDARDKRDRRR